MDNGAGGCSPLHKEVLSNFYEPMEAGKMDVAVIPKNAYYARGSAAATNAGSGMDWMRAPWGCQILRLRGRVTATAKAGGKAAIVGTAHGQPYANQTTIVVSSDSAPISTLAPKVDTGAWEAVNPFTDHPYNKPTGSTDTFERVNTLGLRVTLVASTVPVDTMAGRIVVGQTLGGSPGTFEGEAGSFYTRVFENEQVEDMEGIIVRPSNAAWTASGSDATGPNWNVGAGAGWDPPTDGFPGGYWFIGIEGPDPPGGDPPAVSEYHYYFEIEQVYAIWGHRMPYTIPLVVDTDLWNCALQCLTMASPPGIEGVSTYGGPDVKHIEREAEKKAGALEVLKAPTSFVDTALEYAPKVASVIGNIASLF